MCGYVSIRFSCDVAEMSLETVHSYLTQSYWSTGVPLEVVRLAMENSVCFGMFDDDVQIAFGRFITDQATFAYLADVFVTRTYQGRGIGKRMMAEAFTLPQVQGLRRVMLATASAHGLYRKFGFNDLAQPEIMMEKTNLDIYQQ